MPSSKHNTYAFVTFEIVSITSENAITICQLMYTVECSYIPSSYANKPAAGVFGYLLFSSADPFRSISTAVWK